MSARAIGWTVFALCAGASAVATPTVWAKGSHWAGLVLLWAPLVVALGIWASARAGWLSSSKVETKASSSMVLEFLLFAFAGMFHAGGVLHALGRTDLERAWSIAVCVVFLGISVMLPEPDALPAPPESWKRWFIERWRWGWIGVSLLALSIATFAEKAGGFIPLLSLVNLCTPALWIRFESETA